MWAGEMAVFEKAQYDINKQGYRPEYKIGFNGYFNAGIEDADTLKRVSQFAESLCDLMVCPFYRVGTEGE